MSDSIVDLVSDSQVETLHASIMEISPDFHLRPLSRNHLELEIIYLSDDCDLEMLFGYSLEEGTASSDSLEAFLSNINKEVNRVEVPMPPRVLS